MLLSSIPKPVASLKEKDFYNIRTIYNKYILLLILYIQIIFVYLRTISNILFDGSQRIR